MYKLCELQIVQTDKTLRSMAPELVIQRIFVITTVLVTKDFAVKSNLLL